MPKLTIFFGVLMVAISAGFYFSMTPRPAAALHPAGIGALLILCGILAASPDSRRRMLWMHIAVTLGLIGFLTTAVRAAIELAHGFASIVDRAAFYERVTIALVSLLFVGLCVRSFIAARRARTA